MRGGSNFSRIAAFVLFERLGGETIQLAVGDVLLQLAIPRLPGVLSEPFAERGEFLGSQHLHFALESFNTGHDVPKFSRVSRIPHRPPR